MQSTDGRFVYLSMDYKPVPPGSAPKDVHRFSYVCRSRPGERCTINLRDRGHDLPNRSWTWNGSVDKPTITPSINCRDCWHGFITDGVYQDTARRKEEKQ